MPEISLKFELSSEKLFDKNQLKIDFSIAVCIEIDLKSHCEQYAYLRGQRKSFFSLLNKSSHMKQSINSRKCVTNG